MSEYWIGWAAWLAVAGFWVTLLVNRVVRAIESLAMDRPNYRVWPEVNADDWPPVPDRPLPPPPPAPKKLNRRKGKR